MNEPEKKRIILQFLTFRKKTPVLLRSNRLIRGMFLFFMLPFILAGSPDPANSSESESVFFDISEVTIVTADGHHRFWTEIAQSTAQRQQGLMGRREMPADRGMLFDFRSLQQIHMWMKNTYIPLDMIFLDETGRITAIAANTTPLSTTVLSSPGPARAVLELNGGTAVLLGIKVGDKVLHRIFQP